MPHTLRELGPERATLQTTDMCSLRCPGCYISAWTDPKGDVRRKHKESTISKELIARQLEALGTEINDVHFLGAEPTMAPEHLDKIREVARNMGATVMSITNGARNISHYERTFREGLDSKEIYKINISLDSIDPQINNRLRGRSWAYKNTIKTIQHAIENNDPIKVATTVWPDNYHTVLETVEELYRMGVRGFAFHAGSMEGVRKGSQLAHVEPAAWRALAARLLEFRDSHSDIDNFTLPYIFFSKEELDKGIIGSPESVAVYERHLQELEAGARSPAPVRACPVFDVPQVYLFGNDSNAPTLPTMTGSSKNLS